MDAQTFLDNFATIAEAPGGVQRLRDLVLELAVSGRLVDQAPEDHNADGLLEVIAEERAALIASGRRRKQKARVLPERPSPDGWKAVDLGTVLDLEYGKALPAKDRESSGTVPVYGSNGIVGYHDTALVAGPCVVVGRKGSAGAVNVSEGPCWPIDTTYFVEPLGGMSVEFVSLLLRASRLDKLDRATAVPGLNREEAYAMPALLPPLAEQERIVAKVDELMRRCDDLEARQGRRHRATTRFRTSALRALTQAETTDGMLQAWERLDANWEAVTLTAEEVGSLQATVLQLAVEGRLVSRLPHEGTADKTLSEVNEERARLVREGAIARSKTPVPVAGDERPYDLPEHWKWVHVEDVVTHIVDCLHRTPPYTATGIPAIRTSDVEPGRVLVDKALLVNEATYLEQTRRLVPQEGDVLYSREGGRFGIAAVVPPNTKLCLSQRMMQFRCAAAVSPDYFAWFLNSPLGFGQATEDVGGSASPHVNIKSIRRFVMPLPPYGEQLRIVGAITQILGAIDDLALSLERREERAGRLADAASALFTG